MTFSCLLDRLLDALRAADAALHRQAPEAAREGLDEAFASLGALYATLDSTRHPELSAYLQFVFDECLQAIGAASPTRREGLASTIRLLYQVRAAQTAHGAASSGEWPAENPCSIAPKIAV